MFGDTVLDMSICRSCGKKANSMNFCSDCGTSIYVVPDSQYQKSLGKSKQQKINNRAKTAKQPKISNRAKTAKQQKILGVMCGICSCKFRTEADFLLHKEAKHNESSKNKEKNDSD
jgi:uncharacterized OB-fold protein